MVVGVLAWELFSYGAVPYAEQEVKTENDLLALFRSGFILEKPDGMHNLYIL